MSDTIIALATPPGSSALAMLRISGSHAISSTEKHLTRELQAGKNTYSIFYKDINKTERIDDVIVSAWKNPASFTGEDIVEISCHGNMLITEAIIQALIQTGNGHIRHARPGEFTERAFMNGKLDLTQAEAIMDLIHARSERALQAAQQLQRGKLGQRIHGLQSKLLDLLAHLEAYIDFPDEDIQPEVGQSFIKKMETLLDETRRLLSYSLEGRRIRQGVRVVLIGAPNAGKSSLLNVLINQDRAIVSERPGTTRDTIEESIVLHGINVHFVDTAGIRKENEAEEIEKLGIERTYKAIEAADLIVYVEDGTATTHSNADINSEILSIKVRTKADLKNFKAHEECITVSIHNDASVDHLKQEITNVLRLCEGRSDGDLVAINSRHEALLQEAEGALVRALSAYKTDMPPELISSDLRIALDSWGEIVGKLTNEDMLDRLFSSFCIGK
ncbi:MAG: tRNA uridine-5-carboxymethylaminomethyl(34) synthesis GTPase MnmE [Verrucomicrobiota bacterium]